MRDLNFVQYLLLDVMATLLIAIGIVHGTKISITSLLPYLSGLLFTHPMSFLIILILIYRKKLFLFLYNIGIAFYALKLVVGLVITKIKKDKTEWLFSEVNNKIMSCIRMITKVLCWNIIVVNKLSKQQLYYFIYILYKKKTNHDD